VILFAEACRLYPLHRQLRYLLIDLLIKQGRLEAAQNEIETAMVLFGTSDGIVDAAINLRERIDNTMPAGNFYQQNSVSLCLITRNEERNLPRCLFSIKPVVDEIVVVDTGSSDRTCDIAKAFGARVFTFNWCQDFAAARNHGIDKAKGDIILIIDADEVIAPQDQEELKRLLNHKQSLQCGYSVVTRNYTALCNLIDWTANDGTYFAEEAGTGWTPSEKVRIFPKRPGLRFDYPVHEVIRPSLEREGIKIRNCSIPVHHYGQLNQMSASRKGASYYQIGIRKLDQLGKNPMAIQELAVQAGNLGRWEEAVDLWHNLLALEPDNARAYVNLSTTYDQLGRYNDARSAALRAVDLDIDVKEAHFNIARAELHLGRAAEAAAYLKPLVVKNRDYYAAQFTLGCALICDDRMQEGLDIISRLKTTSLWPAIAYSFEEIAQSLLNATQNDYSVKVHQAASRLELSIQLAIEAQDPAPVLSRASAG
jgi:glycosyltransferase involved in cell wall biosynthesis